MKNEKKPLRDWYTETYPTDDLGYEINPSVTFEDLFNTLDRYRDPYKLIGFADSIVRERLFGQLAEIMDVPYQYILDQYSLHFEIIKNK